MLYWCIKNIVGIICFTILAIKFDAWWIVLFSALFMSDYKETPINNESNNTKENDYEHKNN